MLSRRWIIVLTLLYGIALALTAARHEVWRDEVVPYSLAAASTSPMALMSEIRSYGHPALWPLVIYTARMVFPDPLILKILNVAISMVAVFFFLRLSPFDRAQKFLFIFGLYPFYHYGVIARPYALTMFAVLVTAHWYAHRHGRMLGLGLCLAFLANTHALGLIMTGAVLSGLVLEVALRRRLAPRSTQSSGTMAAVIPALVGMVLAVVQLWPDGNSQIFSLDSLRMDGVVKAGISAVLVPGREFSRVFGFLNWPFVNAVIWGVGLSLWRRPALAVIFGLSVAGWSAFFQLVYPFHGPRHEAFLVLLMAFILWQVYFEEREEARAARSGRGADLLERLRAYRRPLWTFLLLLMFCFNLSVVKEEWTRDYSASRRLGALIAADARLQDAIIMGESGAGLEALPYYATNDIFFYREHIFRSYRRFFRSNLQDADLDRLLAEARRLAHAEQREILIVLDRWIRPGGPTTMPYLYGETFRFDAGQLERFQQAVEPLAALTDVISDEGYNVYLLRQEP